MISIEINYNTGTVKVWGHEKSKLIVRGEPDFYEVTTEVCVTMINGRITSSSLGLCGDK